MSTSVSNKGPIIGFYMDRPIFDWIEDESGWRWTFVGICGPCVELEKLEPDICVITPGLLYRLQKKAGEDAQHIIGWRS